MGFLSDITDTFKDPVGAMTLGMFDTGAADAAAAGREGQAASIAAQESAAQRSLRLQREMWQFGKRRMRPYEQQGLRAVGQLRQLQRGNYDLTRDPVYQQRVEEQGRAIGASGAARGMQLSGRTLGELSRMTSSELGQAYDRRSSFLSGRINRGFSASSMMSGMGQQYAAGRSATLQGLADSQSQYHQNMASISAQEAQAPFQTLMSLGQLAASFYGGGSGGSGGGGGSMAMNYTNSSYPIA